MSKLDLHVLKLSGLPIFEQLKIEEALLRCDERNFVIFNAGSPPAVVLGISCKIDEHVKNDCPLDVISRFSGGGSVVVDSNTQFVSLIFNSDSLKIQPFPKEILEWSRPLYNNVIPDFDILENDYVIGKKKFGGNAHYLTKKRFIHHASLLWDYDVERMNNLLLPPKMPHYREKRGHGDFLCCLKDFLPSKEALQEGLIENLKKQFTFHEFSLEEAEAIAKLPHRKGTVKHS